MSSLFGYLRRSARARLQGEALEKELEEIKQAEVCHVEAMFRAEGFTKGFDDEVKIVNHPLTIEECKEKDHFLLVRKHGEYSFHIGFFDRYKIEKAGKIISGGTNLKLGVAKFNHWTGLESVAESMVRQSESYKP